MEAPSPNSPVQYLPRAYLRGFSFAVSVRAPRQHCRAIDRGLYSIASRENENSSARVSSVLREAVILVRSTKKKAAAGADRKLKFGALALEGVVNPTKRMPV